jgi:hypothetical protein
MPNETPHAELQSSNYVSQCVLQSPASPSRTSQHDSGGSVRHCTCSKPQLYEKVIANTVAHNCRLEATTWPGPERSRTAPSHKLLPLAASLRRETLNLAKEGTDRRTLAGVSLTVLSACPPLQPGHTRVAAQMRI